MNLVIFANCKIILEVRIYNVMPKSLKKLPYQLKGLYLKLIQKQIHMLIQPSS